MNVLVLGSGGREHALSWKIRQSPLVNELFIAPGNAGTSSEGENLDIDIGDFSQVAGTIREKHIDLLVVGPEDPLVNGIRDYLEKNPASGAVRIVGPAADGARLEGSKDFAKQFMKKYGIPTANYKSFTADEIEEARQFLKEIRPPYVLKADGLAAGKGVLILSDIESANAELGHMLNGKFGRASQRVVIEEFLKGTELSVFILTDGKDYVLLPEAKDYKRIGEADVGLNTGGMGAVSPVPFVTSAVMKEIENNIVIPTVRGIEKEGMNYRGFLFFGLMKVSDAFYVIEYNVRMGDPESEVVIPRIKSDLVPLLLACSEGGLAGLSAETLEDSAATVMMVSGGYPEKYEKGKVITGLEASMESIAFHAGTKKANDLVVTNGGRVLSITSLGADMRSALVKSYSNAERIGFEKKYFRRDIGFDLQ